MTETTMQGALLEDLTFDVAVELTKKGDILFSPIEKYMHDAKHQARADENMG